jgi:aspartyl-tRNA(Asn)/glutamyl-tRNA(Gln) amidotransferase subunit A
MTDEIAFLPAAEIARRVRAKAMSAREVTEATLARIDRLQPRLNCFITVSHERARADAAEIDRKIARGEDPGPLAGVPLSVKDLVNTAGVKTTFASLMHADNVPARDAVSVARLKAAGAVLVGKTTTPEFGHMCWTQAPLFGRTANVWDATRTAGGSSGGAAVAAAAGLGQLAIATCAGGSTRIPAAANGVVGFKQSQGLVPHDMSGEAFGNLSYITPTTRTVHDTALMLDAMAGPDECDPHSFGMTMGGLARAVDEARDLEGVRVAWRPFLGNTVIDDAVLALTRATAFGLEEHGARLAEMADDMQPTEPMWLVLSTALWRARFADKLPEWRDRMSPTLVAQIDRGVDHTAEQYVRALMERTRIFRQVQGWFADYDIIAMPTLTRTALPIREALYEPIEIMGRPVDSVRKAWYPYTHPFNLTGHPAVTIPAGLHPDGLPVGLQLVARRGADALLLQAARLLEESRPWGDVRAVI